MYTAKIFKDSLSKIDCILIFKLFDSIKFNPNVSKNGFCTILKVIDSEYIFFKLYFGSTVVKIAIFLLLSKDSSNSKISIFKLKIYCVFLLKFN